MKRRSKKALKLRPNELTVFIICTVSLLLLITLTTSGIANGMLAFVMPAMTSQCSDKESNDTKPQKTRVVFTKKEEKKNDTTIPLSLYKTDKPSILIYHTHTLEAYTSTDKYPYTEKGGRWRTNDNTRNIVTVGETLANELRNLGFNVIHDITNHEPPKLATAYSRSLETMLSYKRKYPSLVMFIDVHRDATGDDNTNDYCIIDGQKTARLMFVVGTGKGATGTGFGEMPDFDSNYALASSITEYLRNINNDLVREIRVKTGRYNQHVSNHSLLVEVGHNMNTLEEALSAIKHLAKAIAAQAK